MPKEFTEFRKKVELPFKPLLEEKPELMNHIKKFVLTHSGLSEDALVALVVLHNSGTLEERCKEELQAFDYIIESKVSEIGMKFLNDEKTIERLKQML